MINTLKIFLFLLITMLCALSTYDLINISAKDIIKPSTIQKIDNLPKFSLEHSGAVSGTNPMIRIHDSQDRFLCSGSVISDRYILTAAHCLVSDSGFLSNEEYTIHVLNINPELGELVFKAKAGAVNIDTDYALMVGEFYGTNKFELALGNSASVITSGNVVTCGYPYGGDSICYRTSGEFSNYIFRMATQGILYPGMSGGPVYDITRRLVIGVNSAAGAGVILVSSLVGLFESLGVEVE